MISSCPSHQSLARSTSEIAANHVGPDVVLVKYLARRQEVLRPAAAPQDANRQQPGGAIAPGTPVRPVDWTGRRTRRERRVDVALVSHGRLPACRRGCRALG